MSHILSIDQGTTSTRAIIFNEKGDNLASHQIELKQYFPHDGWVEHDPEEIWTATVECCRKVIEKLDISATEVDCIGISNQRETTVIWDKETGKPIHRAIVWQDRRTADLCNELRAQSGVNEMIAKKSGLLLDPYFSASKAGWILQNMPGAREKARTGRLLFGTIDTYLIWRLTMGRRHVTDATNASRTMLYDIRHQRWSRSLTELFNVPRTMLPEVLDNCAEFGLTHESILGAEIPITGVAGDQQAATVGQACFKPGMAKSTYGTGCFVLLNTGDKIVESKNRMLSTIAYRINGEVTYGLEGSIFIAGAAVQWLRDGIHLVKDASETEVIAASLKDTGNVYLVPAFTGLGAPYWDAQARGAIVGLTRDSSDKHIIRAGLEAVCYQTKDLIQAMTYDGAQLPQTLRVDGGMVSNNWLLQFLSDILDADVERPKCIETSAMGAAMLAALGHGLFDSLDDIAKVWRSDRVFQPELDVHQRDRFYGGWLSAVAKVSTH